MYRIVETEDGFVVVKKVDERTEVRESEVYANRACAEKFMAQLADGYMFLCGLMG